MANTTENVIIEFTSDTSGLQPAVDQLEKLGTIDKKAAEGFKAINDQLAKSPQKIQLTAEQFRKTGLTLDQLVAKVKQGGAGVVNFDKKLEELEKQLKSTQKELGEANKRIADLEKGGKKFNETGNTMKSRLREMTQRLAELKAAGRDNTEEFKTLTKEAGNLQDAINDARQEIRNAASDTSVFDGLISAAQGVTGAFAVGQGAIALFGDESEELQETLLKVNALMAILQGLQQVQNVLQKESAASRLADVIAAKAQVAIQRIYTFVTGQATAATTAFKVALATTGIGLVVVAVLALVDAFSSLTDETEEANKAIEANAALVEAYAEGVDAATEKIAANQKLIGVLESEIIKTRGRGLLIQRKDLIETNKLLAEQRDTLESTSEAYFALNKAIDDNNSKIKEIDDKVVLTQIDLQLKLREEANRNTLAAIQDRLNRVKIGSKQELELKKQLERTKADQEIADGNLTANEIINLRSETNKKIAELELEFRRRLQENVIALTESNLAKEISAREKVSNTVGRREIDLQQQLIRQKAELDLMVAGQSEQKKTEIRTKALAEITKLERQFQEQSAIQAIQGLISRNNKELSQLNISNSEKQRLLEENIILQAQLEVDAAKDNAEKVKEINAKRDADIRQVRLEILQDTLRREEELEAARTGAAKRNAERIAGSERASLQQRLDAINRIATLDIESVNRRQDANDEALRKGLISQADYNLEYEKLKDEEVKITEEAELRKQELIRESNQRQLEFALETGAQLLDIIGQFGAQATQRESIRISDQRAKVQELREAGAITEKEAIQRQKRLDLEERQAKRKAAERDKALAIFAAVINTAQGISKTIAQLGMPAAIPFIAVAAAIGLAQVALIASRPIPKFKKGKKDSYEGPGKIAEAGMEILEKDGRMYLATKETLVWLGKKDKVYNPKETADIMNSRSMPHVRVQPVEQPEHKYEIIDYDKLGDAMAKRVQPINLSVDGYKDFLLQQNSFTKYLNNRRGY